MQKILIIQTAFIGDAFLTLPMIEKLKESNPNSVIDVISIPSTQEIFNSSPFVNNVHVLDKKNKHKGFLSIYNFSKKLKSNNYDIVYSPHRSYRSAIITRFIKPKRSFSFSNSNLKFLYTDIVKYKNNVHEVQRNLDLISNLYDAESWRIIPTLEIDDSTKNKVDDFFVNLDISGKFAAIAPGSIWETKKYPKEYFIEVIKSLVNESFTVFLIGNKDDKELCESIIKETEHNVINTAGKFSLIESVEFLKRLKILIANDSAPTHMGVCANIPVLTIYCSTVKDFGFYPYNKKSSYISYNNLNCKPCGIHGYQKCPEKTFDCGNLLKPEKIISKIKEMLNDRN